MLKDVIQAERKLDGNYVTQEEINSTGNHKYVHKYKST